MKLFGRKKSEDNAVPADLQQYYNSGNPGIGKWIIRVVFFVIVLALLVGAGVWLFNKLSNKSDQPAAQATSSKQAEAEKKAAQEKAKAAEDAKKATAEAKAKAAEAQKKADAAAAKEKAAEDARKQAAAPTQENGVTGSTTTPAPAPAPTTPQPSATAELPNSGPGTAIAAIFASASAFGALVHSMFIRRRQVR